MGRKDERHSYARKYQDRLYDMMDENLRNEEEEKKLKAKEDKKKPGLGVQPPQVH